MTLIVILSLLTLASGALTIFAQFRESKRLEYVFKPLTMIWIILIVVLNSDPFSTRYQVIILLGLLASLVGDIFLMLPNPKYFLYGLASFLTAHLFYIVAFTVEGGKAPLIYIVPFALYGVIVLWQLWPYLGIMKRPVMVYVGVILIMAWQAANRWIGARLDGSLLSMIGAYLFVMSDSALAVERFRGSWRSAPFWVLTTYFAAQWLIALSV
jgi:uncharacterized membrane protein YhhN